MPELVATGARGSSSTTSTLRSGGRAGRHLSRQHCRADVEHRFTAARMVEDYAELFSRIASGGPSAVSRSTSSGTSTKANRTDASLAPVGQQQPVAVRQRAAAVDDVRDVALALVRCGSRRGRRRRADHAARGRRGRAGRTHGVLAHRPDAVGQHQPAGLGLDRRAAVAELDELPGVRRLGDQLLAVPEVGMSEYIR